MNSDMRSRIALLVGLLLHAACRGATPPTALPAASPGYVMAGTFALSQPVPRTEGPLQEVEVLLDGKRIASRSLSPGASIVYFTLPDVYVQSGVHDLSIRVVRQSVSPTEYRVVGAVVVLNTTSYNVQQFSWPSGTTLLREGDAISMRIDVVQ